MDKNKLLIGIGLLAILVGVGIYVIAGTRGNGEAEVTVAQGQCTTVGQKTAELSDRAVGEIAAFRTVDAPVSLSDIAFQDQSGADRTLVEWQGKSVLLNLWATWCAPCREEMPALEALEKNLGGDKFAVVPISIDLDTPDKPKAFYEEIGLQALPFFHEGELAIFNRLKKQGLAFGMPTTLLLDEESCVLGVLNGPAHWDSDDARALIEMAIE